jgi:hypothetical protein
MKRNTTLLAYVLTLTSLCHFANAQNAGDFRSNQTGTNYLWTLNTNWEVYDGTTWVTPAAGVYPTASTAGVITIRDDDSLTITGGTSFAIDQVVITANAILSIFSGTFTLDDDPGGEDLIVDGRLYIGTNTGILNGSGSILVNNTGWLFVRNSARLQVASTVNNGYFETTNNAFLETGSFTNNGLFNWGGGGNNAIALNNAAQLNNNGTFQLIGTGNRTINSNGGVFNNNTTGIINNSAGLAFTIVPNVTFDNQGDIQGTGIWSLPTAATNTGTITPKGGTLRVNGSFISAKDIEINARPLNIVEVSGIPNVDLSTTTLTVTDDPAVPVGEHTIMTVQSGQAANFVGPFGAVNLPSNYGNLQITNKAITVEKMSTVPLTWGSFTARQNNGKVALNWTTLQEINVSHFVVEHSTDGLKYISIGQVAAIGNSNDKNAYAFEHASPQHNGRNFYRILEVDVDGKSEYSVVRTIKMGDNSSATIAIRNNPVVNGVLVLESDITNARALITGINGAVVQEIRLHQGINNIDVTRLPAAMHVITVFDSKTRIFTGKFIKR